MSTAAPESLVFHDRITIESRSFWQRLLRPPLLRSGLRPDFQASQPIVPASVCVDLAPETRERLTRVTQGSELLRSAVLAAALMVVLSRYNDSPQVMVGCGTEKAKGLLPLGAAVDPDRSFKQMLLEIRQAIIDGRKYGDYPWRSVLEAQGVLAPPTPWAIGVASTAPDTAELEDIDAMVVASAEQQRPVEIAYDATRFLAATIEQFGRHFGVVLTHALADVNAAVGAIPLMDQSERYLTVVEWNQTAKPLPDWPTFDRLFRQQVEAHGEREALAGLGKRLTYAELDRAVTHLAAHLRARGGGRGSVVGICLRPGTLRIVALLAVLRAGAAFLPLDPDYPSDRLRFMMEDARIGLLLKEQNVQAELADLPGTVVDPASLMEEPAPTFADHIEASPDDPAYVIYTSGSTGRPKGAVLAHRGLVNLVLEQIWLFQVRPDSRVLQFASFSFDAAVSEIGMALCSGAALIVADREEMLPGNPLAELLQNLAISHVTLPPSSLSAMPRVSLPLLRTLVVAGEPCQAGLVERWAPDRLFINGYGPTECTVGVSFAKCEAGVARPSIGKLISNVRGYVLSVDGQPQPIGVPGELHIGGLGVALGYLNRPELTAEKFVRDPFSDDPSLRLYRTGDLVRWLPDGSLDFLGRIDDQVKLRGYRIEPGEIESAIAAHTGVREVCVVVRTDRRGEQQLVAFVVRDNTADGPAPSDLRHHVSNRLPGHMIPQAFVFLDALPQTPNLKVDRAALERLPTEDLAPASRGTMPRDPIEFALQKIWESTLGRSPIGITDNFFELGGYSMLAVRLMAAIEAQLGSRLHVNALFASPTIEGLAVALRTENQPSPLGPVVALSEAGSKPALWIVHPAGGTVFCYAPLVAALGEDQPVYGLQSFGIDAGQRPLENVEAMASAYLSAIRKQKKDGPWLLAGWSFGGLVAHEMAQMLERQGTPAAFVGLIDTFAPAILPTALRDLDDAQNLVNLFGADISLDVAHLRALPAESQLAEVLSAARAADLVAPDFDLENVARLVAVYTANAKAVFDYRPGQLSGRLHLFRAKTFPPGPAGDVAREAPALGWEAKGGVEVSWYDGDHQAILRLPVVAELARAIATRIDTVLGH